MDASFLHERDEGIFDEVEEENLGNIEDSNVPEWVSCWKEKNIESSPWQRVQMDSETIEW